jgi:hypothetical protein
MRDKYKKMKGKFGGKGWCGLSIAELSSSLDLEELYRTFYVEASHIAHGGSSCITVPRCTCFPGVIDGPGRDYGAIAVHGASALIWLALSAIDDKFQLGQQRKLAEFRAAFKLLFESS